MMSKYQEALSNYFTAKLQFDNEMYKSMELLEELIDERPRLIKALKDINELLECLTLEQKKSLGATVYTIQAIIIETLEKGEYE